MVHGLVLVFRTGVDQVMPVGVVTALRLIFVKPIGTVMLAEPKDWVLLWLFLSVSV